MRRPTVSVMARPRRPQEPSTYQPQPEIPTELRQRFDVIRAVLGERLTISDAAKELSIARVNMQSMVHRAEAAILSSLQPRSSGPAAKPAAQRDLEAEVERLRKQNQKLTHQLQAADDMMAAAGEIIRSLRGMPPSRTSRRSKRARNPAATETDDPEPPATTQAILRRALEALRTSASLGGMIARMLGISIKTLKRWLERRLAGKSLVQRRGGVRKPGPPDAEQRVRTLVQDLHGLPGADSLSRSVAGVSRRRAAELKREVLTDTERQRRRECRRVEFTRPGVVRGFDAMYLKWHFVLTAADACVPFRTTMRRVPEYTADHVAGVLDDDFRDHGAPLVIRLDRARCHTAEPVLSVLRTHRVLVLHGPPRYPQYYGQHERQNVEHRAWLDGLDASDADLDKMKTTFNDCWRRPTLDWKTAAECWNARPPIHDDRDELQHEVHERVARLCADNVPNDLAMRLAIEQALIKRGYLRVT